MDRLIGPGRRQWSYLVAASSLALVVTSCSPSTPTQASTPRHGGTVTVAIWKEPHGEAESLLTCNIIAASSHTCAYVNPVMEGLLTVKATSDPLPANPTQADYWVPQLATEVPTLANGDVKVSGTRMDVTWKLRHNVKWHDGVPFTSKDVKATFDFWWLKYRDKNPTPILTTSGWDQVDSVDTPDLYTAVVHFHVVYAAYLTLGTGPYGILPDHLLQQVWAQSGDVTRDKVTVSIPGGFNGSGTLTSLMVGTGPFMFKELALGSDRLTDHVTLVRNPHWWGGGGRPYLDGINVKFEIDPNQQLDELHNKTIDLGLDMRPSLLAPLLRDADITTAIVPDSGAEHIDINLHNTFLQEANLRQAILMAIDRQKLIQTLLLGKSVVPPDAWMCIGTGSWCLSPRDTTTRYNPVAARSLLTDAGYQLQTSGSCKGFRTDPQGRCVTLHLASTNLAMREQQEVSIAADLAAVGIQVVRPFDNVSSQRLFDSCTSGGVIYSHNFDLAMYTNTYSFPAEPDSLAYTAYHSSQVPTETNGCSGQNTTFVNDAQLDQALDQGRLSVKPSDRKDKYIVAQQRLATIIPEIPLYQSIDIEAYTHRLVGYKPNEFWWMSQTADWWLNR